MAEIFELTFNDNGVITTVVLENEPIGYDSVDFILEQDDDRYGRDIYFAGSSNFQLEFSKHAHYDAFVLLEQLYEKFGFESDVTLRIIIGQEQFMGNLDFLTSEYNGYDNFKFTIVQQTKEALVKKRIDLVVDLFSDKDLDGNPSTPAPIHQMLLPAKQIYRESVWENREGDKNFGFVMDQVLSVRRTLALINGSNGMTKSEINSTTAPITGMDLKTYNNTANGSFNDFTDGQFKQIINATTDLTNLQIDINFNGSSFTISNSFNFEYNVMAVFTVGSDPKNPRLTFNIDGRSGVNGGNIQTISHTFLNGAIVIPKVNIGESVWFNIYVDVKKYIASSNNFQASFNLNYKNVTISAKTFEQTFDVIVPSISVYDACKKIINDISGLKVNFPLAQVGALKNNYIFSGNIVRKINKPFLVSFEDVTKWFPELNLDYEIMMNQDVYIGNYNDFYTDNEIDAIDNVAFDSFTVMQNERYALNKYTYKYNKYQSQKENTEEDTNDIVHGESEYHVQNIQVENLKSVEVEFVRDPFMLQETINNALKEDITKATQDDDTIFIIDAMAMSASDYNKSKTSILYHSSVQLGRLKLSNNGNFRWDLLGIKLGSTFEIVTNENKGIYLVIQYNASEIILAPHPNYPSNVTATGEFFTSFKYVIDLLVVKLKPFVYSKGIVGIGGVKSPETFANLRFSIGLNIRNYWKEYLSTCVKNGKLPKQIKYINNKDYTNPFVNPPHKEDNDVAFVTPILDTRIVETKLIMPFERYLRICKVLRSTDRGFIRTFNPKNEPIYIYPQVMSAVYKTSGLKEVSVSGELKNIPKQINITKTSGFYNIWVHKFETFQVSKNGDYLIFKDMNNIAFYRKSHYSDIKVNGVNYNSTTSVINAINLL